MQVQAIKKLITAKSVTTAIANILLAIPLVNIVITDFAAHPLISCLVFAGWTILSAFIEIMLDALFNDPRWRR